MRVDHHRQEILKLLENNKVNKNWYYKNFFINLGVGHLFDIIHHWFDDNDVLRDAPIAQKLYHIKHGSDDIPTTKFVNFVVGYRKGFRCSGYPRKGNRMSYRSSDYFMRKVSEHTYDKDYTYEKEEVDMKHINECFRTVKYKSILDDKKLLNYFYKLAEEQNIPVMYYILELKNNTHCKCVCGRYKKIKQMSFLKTCSSQQCISEHLRNISVGRDMSHLHNTEMWAMNSKKQIGRVVSDESKNRASVSNKLFWTPEEKRKQTDINIQNGVYIQQSITMKNKILRGEFTPMTSNRLTHGTISSTITGIQNYRSSWEKKFHETYPHLKYEYTRIEYMHNNTPHVYITDFTDLDTHTIIEVKPSSLLEDSKVTAKSEYAKKWALENGFNYNIITEYDFNFS